MIIIIENSWDKDISKQSSVNRPMIIIKNGWEYNKTVRDYMRVIYFEIIQIL